MFYGFLFATLPSLICGTPPEMTLEEFDTAARAELTEKKFLKLISWDVPDSSALPEIYRKMRKFDDFLKLRIAEARREKLGLFTELPAPDEINSDVEYYLPPAVSEDDPLAREQLVDQLRWRQIDELECGHELDFTALCAYRLRLCSLEKYRNRSRNDGSTVFNGTVDRLSEVIDKM